MPKLKTDNLSILLTDLHACQSYLIGVGIVGPIGPGPLGKNPRSIETLYNERKPPKNLNVDIDEATHTMSISWDHSCPLKTNNAYPTYVVCFHGFQKFFKLYLFKMFLTDNDERACFKQNISCGNQI